MDKAKPFVIIFVIATVGLALVGAIFAFVQALIDGNSAGALEAARFAAVSSGTQGALIGILIAAAYYWQNNRRLQQWKVDTIHKQTDSQVEADGDGFFFYVACDNCNDHLRLRVTRSYDLERDEGGGYTWRKTIVDGRCFRKMEASVQFDNAYRVVDKEIEGGRFVGRAEWEENR